MRRSHVEKRSLDAAREVRRRREERELPPREVNKMTVALAEAFNRPVRTGDQPKPREQRRQ